MAATLGLPDSNRIRVQPGRFGSQCLERLSMLETKALTASTVSAWKRGITSAIGRHRLNVKGSNINPACLDYRWRWGCLKDPPHRFHYLFIAAAAELWGRRVWDTKDGVEGVEGDWPLGLLVPVAHPHPLIALGDPALQQLRCEFATGYGDGPGLVPGGVDGNGQLAASTSGGTLIEP